MADFIFTSPGPLLVELGPLTLRWYSVLVTGGIILGTFIAQYLGKKRDIKPDTIADLAVWLVVGGIPMARLYYVLFSWKQFQDNPLSAFAIWQGGIAIHGGILGGLLAGYLFSRRQKLNFWNLMDLVAPGLILGQALGRWGNFFNSEAFGDPTDLPWKLYIPLAQRPPIFAGFEYFHPTFLYESLWNLGVFALLLTLFFRFPQAKPGTIVAAYAVLYGLGRFWIEGLRTDSLMLGPLRIAQVISLGAIFLGFMGLWWLYGRSAKQTPQDQNNNF